MPTLALHAPSTGGVNSCACRSHTLKTASSSTDPPIESIAKKRSDGKSRLKHQSNIRHHLRGLPSHQRGRRPHHRRHRVRRDGQLRARGFRVRPRRERRDHPEKRRHRYRHGLRHRMDRRRLSCKDTRRGCCLLRYRPRPKAQHRNRPLTPMFYPAFKTDWLPPRLARTRFPHARAGLLTLGHLRTLEVLENGLVSTSSAPPEPFDLGQAVAGACLPWRVFRRRAARASWLLRLSAVRCTPSTAEEAEAILHWWAEQTWVPPRAHQAEPEVKAENIARARAIDHAATPTMRLACAVCAVPGWRELLRVRTAWDAPLIAANHLLSAHAELQGAYHFSADLLLGISAK